MPRSLPDEFAESLLRSSEKPCPRSSYTRHMVKADLRKAENADWIAVGTVLNRARELHGWSLKQFADAVARDERQVARWFAGTERPQFEAAFAVAGLRISLVIAMAEQIADAGLEVRTQITAVRKRA